MTAAAKPDSTAAMEHKLVPYYSRLGYALAARVLQSDLYRQLDDVERAQCDELLAAAKRYGVKADKIKADMTAAFNAAEKAAKTPAPAAAKLVKKAGKK